MKQVYSAKVRLHTMFWSDVLKSHHFAVERAPAECFFFSPHPNLIQNHLKLIGLIQWYIGKVTCCLNFQRDN